MRVLIEASAAYNQGAGIGRYSRNILQRLLPLATEDQFTLVRAPEDSSISRFDIDQWPNAKLRTLPFSRRNADRLWFRLRVPLDARILVGRADVVYSPDFTAPPMWRVPRMITVHDLAFLTQPTRTTDALRRYLGEVVPRQVAGADLVAAVSHATATDLRQFYGVPDEKIVIARNAVDDSFYNPEPLSPLDRTRLGLPDRYFAMLGTIEPRKNHALALAAIRQAGLGRTVPLVIVGRYGWGHEEIAAEITTLQAQGLVIHLDNVSDADLPAILAGSQAMVYPSWTEGFGLPVAEALATGIPVVTGTAPALREVGGDFANYVDPEDVDGLVGYLRQFAESSFDPVAAHARTEWTRQFSWDSSTSMVYDALNAISN